MEIIIRQKCPFASCTELFKLEFTTNETSSENVISVEKNRIFDFAIVALEKGLLTILNDTVIKINSAYKSALTNEYYLQVNYGYPVMEIDIKPGFDWWRRCTYDNTPVQ